MRKTTYEALSESFFDRKEIRIIALSLILVTLPLIYALVYATGGITYVYSHTMYIPILLAGIFFGPRIGLVIGLAAGILMGPFMPLSVALQTQQPLANWAYRLFIFGLMGFISGYASEQFRKNAIKMDALSSMNPETNIPNTNYLKHVNRIILDKELSLVTVLINNVDAISDVLGVGLYHQLLKDLHLDFTHQKREAIMIQASQNKLWLILGKTNTDGDLAYTLNILSKARTVRQIPMYVDYAVGISSLFNGEIELSIGAFSESDMAARYAQANNIQSYVYDEGKLKKRSDYELVSNFSNALLKKETFLVFQPKINLETMAVDSVEALIRWAHPTKDLVMPDQFIPLIEETKLIHELTDWVLDKALTMLKKLTDRGYDIGMSINVSAKNLYDPLFLERSSEIMAKHNVDLTKFEIEITETQLMQNPVEAKEVLSKLSKKGIKVSLDDFGSGYSSLAYLTKFPLDIIKIDRVFMVDILTRPQIKQIVAATVALSKELGYKVVAEGIEDEKSAEYLKSIGCDYAQGYFYSKPLKEVDLLNYLSQK